MTRPRDNPMDVRDLQAFDDLIQESRERDERDLEKSSRRDREIEAIEWSKP